MKDKRGGDSWGDKVWGLERCSGAAVGKGENRDDTVCGSLEAEVRHMFCDPSKSQTCVTVFQESEPSRC
jgi:hypothetical protein